LISNKPLLGKCKDFNLRNSIRKLIIDYFDNLKLHLEELEKQKLEEFNKVFKDSNFINIKQRARDIGNKADICEKFMA
jgi:predicted solute-binding protein